MTRPSHSRSISTRIRAQLMLSSRQYITTVEITTILTYWNWRYPIHEITTPRHFEKVGDCVGFFVIFRNHFKFTDDFCPFCRILCQIFPSLSVYILQTQFTSPYFPAIRYVTDHKTINQRIFLDNICIHNALALHQNGIASNVKK